MNRWSCQAGIPDCVEGFSERRDTKNDVDMMSNCQPSLRAIASARGTLGDSMKPNFNVTLEKVELISSSFTRSEGATRGVGADSMVRMTVVSCSTLQCFKLCISAVGALW